jgi:acyl-CoA synthetase (AMP-forming)/AMP-acid ligase II
MTAPTTPALKPVFPDHPPTLPQVIARAVQHHAEREFLVGDGGSWTFARAEQDSAAIALGLLACSLGKGTRVGLWLPTAPAWVLAWWAVGRIGAFAVPLSAMFQPREITWALAEADIDTLFVDSTLVERLERAVPALAVQTSPELCLPELPYLRRIVVVGDVDKHGDKPWVITATTGMAARAAAQPALDRAFLTRVEAQVTPADWLIGVCTSGSTSTPKIVVHTHGSMIRINHAYHAHGMGLRRDDRLFNGMPFFWIGGLNGGLMAATFAGACLVLPQGARPEDILASIERHRVTRLRIWPTQFKTLNDRALQNGRDLTPLLPLIAPKNERGEPIPAERRITSLLGMTECFGPHGFGRFDETLPERNGGSWGRNIDGLERKIVDPQTGAEVPIGTEGELCIRGFALMQGYYKREHEQVFDRDGWFHTGDVCRLDDDGCLYFRGRDSDMIKTAGANVSPQEVELVLAGQPGVAEAVVLGLPDEQRGEIVVAVVVPRAGQSIDAVDLQRLLKEQISAYKVPRRILVMAADALPRTDGGKVRKGELKKRLIEGTPA